jgi:thioester reductase-like protein
MRVLVTGAAGFINGYLVLTTTLSEMLDDVIAWIRAEDAAGAV